MALCASKLDGTVPFENTLHAEKHLRNLGVDVVTFEVSGRIPKTPKTACQGDDPEPKPPTKPSTQTQSKGWFGGGQTQNQKDAEACGKLADQMAKTEYRHPLFQHGSKDSADGKRVTHNFSVRVPGFGIQSLCVSTDKKNLESFKDTSKDTKKS